MPSRRVRVRRGCWCQLCGDFQLDVIGEAEIQGVSQSELQKKAKGQGANTQERLREHLGPWLGSQSRAPSWVYMGTTKKPVRKKQEVGVESCEDSPVPTQSSRQGLA